MTPAEAARAIEDVLAQLEAATKQTVTNISLAAVDTTSFTSAQRTACRYVRIEFAPQYEYLPFSRLA